MGVVAELAEFLPMLFRREYGFAGSVGEARRQATARASTVVLAGDEAIARVASLGSDQDGHATKTSSNAQGEWDGPILRLTGDLDPQAQSVPGVEARVWLRNTDTDEERAMPTDVEASADLPNETGFNQTGFNQTGFNQTGFNQTTGHEMDVSEARVHSLRWQAEVDVRTLPLGPWRAEIDIRLDAGDNTSTLRAEHLPPRILSEGVVVAPIAAGGGLVIDVGATRANPFTALDLEAAAVTEDFRGVLLDLPLPMQACDDHAAPARIKLGTMPLPAAVVVIDGTPRLQGWLSGVPGRSGLSASIAGGPWRPTGLDLLIETAGRMRLLRSAPAASQAPATTPSTPTDPAPRQTPNRAWPMRQLGRLYRRARRAERALRRQLKRRD